MKIAVIGSEGMLGKAMVQTIASNKFEVIPLSRGQLDITHSRDVFETLSELSPDIVINCAGIVKGRDEKQMIPINSIGPHCIYKVCEAIGCRMVHISTDCVFDGRNCYTEWDKPNAEDIYGISKAKGEIVKMGHLTIRCSFIGLGPRGLLSWLMKQEGEVIGFTNSLWNGFTVKYASREILKEAISGNSGIQHIFGEDVSKYDVLVAANKAFNLGLKVIPRNYPVVDHRLRTVTKYVADVPPIGKQLEEMKDAFSVYSCRTR